MTSRKRWASKFLGAEDDSLIRHRSQREAYRRVSGLRTSYPDSPDTDWRVVNVYVDEGHGWQLYECVDLAD